MTCQACGANNPEFHVTCASCGARLVDALSTWPVAGPVASPDLWVGRTVSHYRIIAPLGRGGMGVVYRATDTRLRRPVAIKFLSPLLENDPQARARFLREARAASALDHPNIGTIHEIGEDGGTSFIVMGLYEGETLHERIRRGPVSIAEAEQILGQLVAALGAAHTAGIIHRDVKPSNVLLSAGGPLKLVDFGLAKPLTAVQGLDTLTADGDMVGTVAYMAPEQLEGGTVDVAADIWALGVVAYELIAGRLPFTGPTHIITASHILHDEPEPLRSLRPDVPRHLDGLVHAALDKSPSRRPESMAEIARSLAGDATANVARLPTDDQPTKVERFSIDNQPTELAPQPPRGRSRYGKLLAAVGLVCIALVAGRVLLAGRSANQPPPVPARRGVAVLSLKNASGRDDTAWLAGAFAEMLRSELAAGEKLRVVPGENVARMRLELKLPDADSYAPDTLERIHRNLGADLVVVGSYLAIGDKGSGRIRLDLRVQDAVRGEMFASVAEAAGETELFDLVARAGTELRRQLGVGALSAPEAAALRASEPSHPEAVRLYTAGLDRLRLSDALGGRDLLAQAIAAEPDFPLAHAALGEAWANLGNDARAREASGRALDLSAGLSREERLSVEARDHQAHHDWGKAIDRWRVLFGFFPDDLEYGLKLAEAQISGGNVKDSFETLAALKKLPPPSGDDPRIWLAEARAAESIEDYERERAAAQESARRAEAHGAPLLAARAGVRAAWARGNLADSEHALLDLERVRKTFEEAGDRSMVARIASRAAILSVYKGDDVAARRLFEEELRIDRELGFRSGEGNALANLANIVSDQGDLERAKQFYQEAIAILQEVGDQSARAAALNSYGEVLSETGAVKEAQDAYEEALRIHREIGDQRGVATTLGNLASVRFGEGDLTGARALREEALSLARKLGDDRTAVYALDGLANILRAQGDLPAAQHKLEESVALAKQIDDRVLAARVQTALADLLFETGKGGDAAAVVAPVIAVFHAQKLGAFEAAAHDLRARILLADGKPAEAQTAVDAGVSTLAGQGGETAWALALTAARVRVASGLAADRAAAIKLIDETLANAKASHASVGTLFNLRIERAALASEAVRRQLLVTIEKEAKKLGYDATARRAIGLLGGR